MSALVASLFGVLVTTYISLRALYEAYEAEKIAGEALSEAEHALNLARDANGIPRSLADRRDA